MAPAFTMTGLSPGRKQYTPLSARIVKVTPSRLVNNSFTERFSPEAIYLSCLFHKQQFSKHHEYSAWQMKITDGT
jgi:hypothetical protein